MAAPAIPTNLVAQQANGQVWVTWDMIAGSTSYKVERSIDNINFATVATVTAPAVPEFLDVNVTIGTEYWYRVSSDNGETSSPTDAENIVPVDTGQMTLGQIRDLSKQKADREESQFVTDKEWNVYINQSYFELYDLIIQKYGNEYHVADPLTIDTNGQSAFDLPNGTNLNGAPAFYKLLGVDLALNQTTEAFITLRKFEFIQRNRYVYPQLTTNVLGVNGLRYRLVGNQIRFIPSPQGGQQIRIWYIPRLTMLLKDIDIADGISGWTEYVAVDAAIKALQKEESDVSVLAVQKAFLEKRIEEAAENRDAGIPDTISNTRREADSIGNTQDGPWGGN